MVPHRLSQVHADFNFPTENGQTSYNEMRDLLYQILGRENHSFKLNFNFRLNLRLSLSRFPCSLYRNLFQNHLSWVKKL